MNPSASWTIWRKTCGQLDVRETLGNDPTFSTRVGVDYRDCTNCPAQHRAEPQVLSPWEALLFCPPYLHPPLARPPAPLRAFTPMLPLPSPSLVSLPPPQALRFSPAGFLGLLRVVFLKVCRVLAG